jgi:FMNH2-dependent dimethyl sulfone monooxygenase
MSTSDEPITVHGFRNAVTRAGQSISDKEGMRADSSFEDLCQHGDRFRTRQIYHEEAAYTGKNVLPVVRQFLVPAGV